MKNKQVKTNREESMTKTKNHYKFGHESHIINLLNNRTFERCATFLEPFMRSEMLVLDCGCGPGTITAGFAKRLTKGKVFGIDIEPSQLELAQKNIASQNLRNVEFHQGDILNLPFEDNTFDLVYTNAVVCQLEKYNDAIRELYRVVKPGGIGAIREPDFGGKLFYPENPILMEANKCRDELLVKNHVQIFMGRKLRSLFLKAGFNKALGSASAESYGDKASLELMCNYFIGELENAPFIKNEISRKKISLKKIIQYKEAWRAFSKKPDAFLVNVWCQVVGIK